MSQETTTNNQITNDTVIWRYMNLTKFMSLIYSKSLWFTSIERLQQDDPYEGTFTPIEQYLNNATIYASDRERRYAHEKNKEREKLNASTFVNCWHIHTIEKAPLWKIYAPNGEGVVIESTYGELTDVLQNSIERDNKISSFCVIPVKYISHDESEYRFGEDHDPAKRKVNFYEYEREVRAIICHKEVKNGFLVPVDIRKLIKKIVYMSNPNDLLFSNVFESFAENTSELKGIQRLKSNLLQPAKVKNNG